MGTVNDAFQSLDYLDQRRHVGDLIEGWGLQLCQEGADPLLGHAIKDSFHPAQTARCGLQHVEDLLLLLGVPNQVGLVGVAILAQAAFQQFLQRRRPRHTYPVWPSAAPSQSWSLQIPVWPHLSINLIRLARACLQANS